MSVFKFRIYISITILFVSITMCAQQLFRVEPFANLIATNSHFTMISCDINGDFLEDLVIYNLNSTTLTLYEQLESGDFKTNQIFIDLINPEQEEYVYSLTSYDFNNDELHEFIIGTNSKLILVYWEQDSSQYLSKVISSDYIFSQNISIGDLNNDNLPDIFACHDLGFNRLLWNEGNMSFREDVNTFAVDQRLFNGGNYGSVIVDVNNDGNNDVYLAKCKLFDYDFNSVDRLNALFVNDGFGNFIESSEARGLRDGAQSWTVNFADFDNDGDLDCIVSNHPEDEVQRPGHDINKYYENNGFGKFTWIDSIDIVSPGVYQTILQDFDNNGYIDIFFAGITSHMFLNHGPDGFVRRTSIQVAGDTRPPFSAVCSDIDLNGTMDLFNSYSEGPDRFYRNLRFGNYIGFKLRSNESVDHANARVNIYGEFGQKRRDIIISDSYGIRNTHSLHFGLGDFNRVDSVHIQWNKSESTTLYDLPANQYHYVHKDENYCGKVSIDAPEVQTVCSGKALTLVAPAGYQQYKWNTGSTEALIEVHNNGKYFCYLTDNEGCIYRSNNLYIENYNSPFFDLDTTEYWVKKGEDLVIKMDQIYDGEKYFWYDKDEELIHEGSSINLTNLIEDTNIFVEQHNTGTNNLLTAGPGTDLPTIDLNHDTIKTDFTLYHTVTILGFELMAKDSGTFRLTLHGAQNNMELNYELEKGANQLNLNVTLPPGEYTFLTTDTSLVQTANSSHQYADDLKRIFINSTTYSNSMYYAMLFNWQISDPVVNCISERKQLNINVDQSVSTINNHSDCKVHLSPIPTAGDISVRVDCLENMKSIRIIDLNGRVVFTRSLNDFSTTISLHDLSPSVYFIEIKGKDYQLTRRLLKI